MAGLPPHQQIFRVYHEAINKIPQAPLFYNKPITADDRIAEIKVKLDLLNKNFHPVPFSPSVPVPDGHERLFRVLGLWDFLHLGLSADTLRPDLLIPLIAYHNPYRRRSYTAGVRITVRTSELARALRLPIKKVPTTDSDLALFAEEKTTDVLTDFITNWVAILDDGCVPHREVVAAINLVKEGQPHEVDWAMLVWTMVRKDLPMTPRPGQRYYYASHLQRMIKHQHPELFGTADTSAALADGNDASNKRQISDIDGADNIDDVHLTTAGGNLQKKLRTDGQCDMEQVQVRMEEAWKAKKDFVENEQECKSPRTELQHQNNVSKQKDHTIKLLKKAKTEEKEKVEAAAPVKKERANGKVQMKLRYRNNLLQQEDHTILSLEQAIANGQTELQYMNDLLHHKDRTIWSLEQTIANGQIELRYMNDMLHSKARTIWSLEQVIKNGAPTDMRYRNDMLQQKDQTIMSLEQAIANAQMEMQSMNNMLQQKDYTIISLEKEKTEAEQKVKVVLVENEQEIVNAETELQSMNKKLQQKDEMIQSLEKGRIEATQKVNMILVEKERAIANAQIELQSLNNILQQKHHTIRTLEKEKLEEKQKVEVLLVEKEHATINTQMELQSLNKMLQQKDHTIRSLEKAKLEEEQKVKAVLVEKEHTIANARKELQSTNNMLQEKYHTIRSMEKAKTEEAEKVKVLLLEKEKAISNSRMKLQLMNKILQQKNKNIRSLEKAKMEEAQKRELEASQFTNELRVMSQTIDGYKKDLKEKEEEMHHTAAGVINCFEREWYVKFTECADLIPKLAVKFMGLNENFELLKETYAKPIKVSKTE